MSEDLTLYVYRELSSKPDITVLVGSRIWRWHLEQDMDGTGERAIVISVPRPWATANLHNTAMFPAVQIDSYADPSRDAEGRPLRADGQERALEVAHAIRRILHVPSRCGD